MFHVEFHRSVFEVHEVESMFQLPQGDHALKEARDGLGQPLFPTNRDDSRLCSLPGLFIWVAWCRISNHVERTRSNYACTGVSEKAFVVLRVLEYKLYCRIHFIVPFLGHRACV